MMPRKKKSKKRILGSYPFLSVIFSISLALIVIGLFGLIFIHANKLTSYIRENLEVSVYLEKDISQSQVNILREKISSKRYLDGVNSKITYISRADAAEKFIMDTGEDFTKFIGENPLRASFILKLSPVYYQVDSLEKVHKELLSLKGVYEVEYLESLVNNINENMTIIGVTLGIVALIFILVVVILINNTIKLAMFSQRFLIRSMQLVGATSAFIKRPFLLRSMFYGAVAAVLSILVTQAVYKFALTSIKNLTVLKDDQLMLFLYIIIFLVGIFVAFISTLISVNKYLKTSLDDLY